MEVIISPLKTGVQLSMNVDICDTEAKKFCENLEQIHNMEMDLNLTVSVHNDEHILIVRNVTPQASEKHIEEFKCSVKEFMEAFHKLCIEEPKSKKDPEAPTEKEIEFVKNLVEPDMMAVVGTILCKDGYCDMRISPKVFSQMCDAYIEKYGS